jgi:cell division septum initiation protein DivIVA
MSVTPIELGHVRLPKRFFGYQRSACDRLLERVSQTLEEVWQERDALRERVATLDETLPAQQAELDGLNAEHGSAQIPMAPIEIEPDRNGEQPRALAPGTAAPVERRKLALPDSSGAGGMDALEDDYAMAERRRSELEHEVRELEARKEDLKRDYQTLLAKAVNLVEGSEDHAP